MGWGIAPIKFGKFKVEIDVFLRIVETCHIANTYDSAVEHNDDIIKGWQVALL